MEVSGKKLSDQDRTCCQPCFEDGDNIKADAFCTVCKEFLCSTCENAHRTFKATKRHVLLNKKNMPTSLTDKSLKENTNVPCDIHPKESIKYFCPTHESVNCGHCVVFEHRSCKISLISEISDSFKNGQEYGDIRKSIAKLLKGVNDCVNEVENNIKMILKLSEDEVTKLRDYREKVNDYCNERENFLLEIIEKMKDMDKTRLDSLKPKCDKIKAKINQIKLALDAQENNSGNLFIEAKRVKKRVECLEMCLNDLSKENTVHRYKFIKDPTTERLLKAKTGLGIVSEDQTPGKQMVPIVHLNSVKFTAAPGISVKSTPDTSECWLTGMLLLPRDRLLIADNSNRTLKLLNLQTSSMISQIKVQGQPWGMCHLPGDRIAVCLNNKCRIIFLGTRAQIRVGSSINVDGNCYDIAYHNDQLVVSFRAGKVEKIDMKGNTIKKIDNVKGQSSFSSCDNLTLMDDGPKAVIFVSDYKMNTITKMDMDLNILQTIKNPAIQSPNGLTAVGSQLLISSLHNHRILRLDLSSGKMTQLLGESDGIQHPCSAIYSPNQNKLYIVSHKRGNNDLNNTVYVYKVL